MLVVLQIILSNNVRNAGNTAITHTTLTIAPLDIRVHKDPIISILE